MSHIWIASFPRSGNTFLRTVLWHCFGLRSSSIYPEDMGPQNALGETIGHVDMVKGEAFNEGELALIKTHAPPKDDNPAIYIVRDGREALVSLWYFYKQNDKLKDIIDGKHMFSTWSNHLNEWKPWSRENTLFIRYEDMMEDFPTVLGKLGKYLEREVIQTSLPSRKEMADLDGKMVRPKTSWRDDLKGKDLRHFMKINYPMMKKLGYV